MNVNNQRIHEIKNIITRLQTRLDFLSIKSSRFSSLRLIVFITGVILSIAGFYISKEIGWIAVAVFIAIFSVIVHLHNKLLFGLKRCFSYLMIKEEHLARINIIWDKMPETPFIESPIDLTIEKDLDLTGKYSLHRLLDSSVSKEGSSMLIKWLVNSFLTPDKISERQKIISEFASMNVFRDKFILKSRLISKKYIECRKILEWTKSLPDYKISAWVFLVSLFLPVIFCILFVLSSMDMIGSLWINFLLLYFFIYLSQQKKLSKLIEESTRLEGNFKKFSSLVLYIEKYSYHNSPAIKNFLSSFAAGNINASDELRKLNKVVSALVIRENPIIRLIVNLFFPYDIYFSKKLINVKSEIEKNIDGWINKLNEFECYLSISNFTYLNPDYTFPEINIESKNIFQTKDLGHPLLKRETKICNDFAFEKTNEITIITGSNMSGKSTFLKTIGINLCLAYSGAPVNAGYFKTSLYELFTCIKVNDSVFDGISYFYAEVKKLKQLLDEFQKNDLPEKFFLIDEIFKGTNNKERLEGSREFIKKLSKLKGTGLISTHDLELVNLEEEIPSITNYHFREYVTNGLMEFDYKIHPGPCPTTNALKIMRQSGLI